MADEIPGKPNFKYDFEHAIVVTSEWAGRVAPAQLESASKDTSLPVCNIYLIGRQPRITIRPESWVCDENSMSFVVEADLGGGDTYEVQLDGANPFRVPLDLVTNRPYTLVEMHDASGNMLYGSVTAVWVSVFLKLTMGLRQMDAAETHKDLFDLDVVYVGQSQDDKGALQRRLRNHSTLQKVLGDTAQTAPHLDVWVIVMQFATHDTLGTLGGWSGTEGRAASMKHLRAVHGTHLSSAEVTTLAEAALIRYFQPQYNVLFKKRFPDRLHRNYPTAYDLDCSAIGFEFETLTTIGQRLRSSVVDPKFIHTGLFALHDTQARRQFFDIDDWSDGFIEATYVQRRSSDEGAEE